MQFKSYLITLKIHNQTLRTLKYILLTNGFHFYSTQIYTPHKRTSIISLTWFGNYHQCC